MKKMLFIILCVCLLVGCNNDAVSKETLSYISFDNYLDVSCPIDTYHMVMSSVPGLPLDMVILKDLENHTIEMTASDGTFLLMTNGIIESLDTSYTFEYLNNTIYWAPDKLMSENIDLTIKILSGDEVLAIADYIIALEDGGFIFKQYLLTNQ